MTSVGAKVGFGLHHDGMGVSEDKYDWVDDDSLSLDESVKRIDELEAVVVLVEPVVGDVVSRDQLRTVGASSYAWSEGSIP